MKILTTFDPEEITRKLHVNPKRFVQLYGTRTGVCSLIYTHMVEELACEPIEIQRLGLEFYQDNFEKLSQGDVSGLEKAINETQPDVIVASTPTVKGICEDLAGYDRNLSMKHVKQYKTEAIRKFLKHSLIGDEQSKQKAGDQIDNLNDLVKKGKKVQRALDNMNFYLMKHAKNKTIGLYEDDGKPTITHKGDAIRIAKKHKIPVPQTMTPTELLHSGLKIYNYILKLDRGESAGYYDILHPNQLLEDRGFIAQEKIKQPSFGGRVDSSWITFYAMWNPLVRGRAYSGLLTTTFTDETRIEIPIRVEYESIILNEEIFNISPQEHAKRQGRPVDEKLLKDILEFNKLSDYKMPKQLYEYVNALSTYHPGLAANDFMASLDGQILYIGDTTSGFNGNRCVSRSLLGKEIEDDEAVYMLGIIAAEELKRANEIMNT